ncbi:MAG: hypothetical protein QMB08_02105 [Acidimicrobiales bacterium]
MRASQPARIRQFKREVMAEVPQGKDILTDIVRTLTVAMQTLQ